MKKEKNKHDMAEYLKFIIHVIFCRKCSFQSSLYRMLKCSLTIKKYIYQNTAHVPSNTKKYKKIHDTSSYTLFQHYHQIQKHKIKHQRVWKYMRKKLKNGFKFIFDYESVY